MRDDACVSRFACKRVTRGETCLLLRAESRYGKLADNMMKDAEWTSD